MTGDDYTWIFIFYDRQKPTKRRTNAQTYLVYIFIYPALPPKKRLAAGRLFLPFPERKVGRPSQKRQKLCTGPSSGSTLYRLVREKRNEAGLAMATPPSADLDRNEGAVQSRHGCAKAIIPEGSGLSSRVRQQLGSHDDTRSARIPRIADRLHSTQPPYSRWRSPKHCWRQLKGHVSCTARMQPVPTWRERAITGKPMGMRQRRTRRPSNFRCPTMVFRIFGHPVHSPLSWKGMEDDGC